MNIQVLGCSGAIAQGSRTTAFLVDDNVLIDAGTGAGDLTLEEMVGIDHVFLTHAHLDHIAALPLMLDAIGGRRSTPVKVHALPGTIEALRLHIFNDTIWPDFSRIPTEDAPFMQFCPITVGQTIVLPNKAIEVLPAVHTVPAAGFSVSSGGHCWVFTGDTGHNPALWARINQLPVRALVIETAFGDKDEALAQLSQHLSPRILAQELNCIDCESGYPIYITHTKPARTEQIMSEVYAHTSNWGHTKHGIHRLQAGQKWQI